MPIRIRRERPDDAPEIAEVVEAAFGDASVAAFTDELRRSPGYVPELPRTTVRFSASRC